MLNANDLEQIKRIVVDPTVEAVRAEVAPLVQNDQRQQERLDALEKNQGRALAGLAAYATALSIGLGFTLDYIKRKIGW